MHATHCVTVTTGRDARLIVARAALWACAAASTTDSVHQSHAPAQRIATARARKQNEAPAATLAAALAAQSMRRSTALSQSRRRSTARLVGVALVHDGSDHLVVEFKVFSEQGLEHHLELAGLRCSRASRSLLASKHSDSCWRRSTAIRLAGVEAQRQPASSPPPQSQTSAASACSRSAASRAARSAASACCFWTCPRWAFLSGELPQQLEAGPTAGVEALLPP